MRKVLIAQLTEIWRDAENEFLAKENDTPKHEAMQQQEASNLTEEEKQELQKRLQALGV